MTTKRGFVIIIGDVEICDSWWEGCLAHVNLFLILPLILFGG